MSRSSRTLYVGNLPGDVREREYGPIVHIDLKIPPRPPGYAFVEFEESRDAEDAIRGRDGYDFDGHRLRVELAHGGRGNSSSADRHTGSRGPRGGVSRRSEYRVLITGLPQSASWQDLKDHMRRAGDVCFSQVFHEGSGKTGIVDYTNFDDMKYAVSHLASLPFLIKKLDGSEFRNAFSRGRVHVKEYDSSRSRSRSRSRSPSYSKGRSNGRSKSKNPSVSRSRSRRFNAVSIQFMFFLLFYKYNTEAIHFDESTCSKSPKGKSSCHSRSRSKSVSRSRSGSKVRSLSRYGYMRDLGIAYRILLGKIVSVGYNSLGLEISFKIQIPETSLPQHIGQNDVKPIKRESQADEGTLGIPVPPFHRHLS
ncbi:hypothetical protein SASPL_100018 [Salvia splendens]|uniref:RRM domain-containing protein n=1 Tax=Salvia splendens TaxID=180675 RepID=A0A8X8YLL6_SALSN|nr:hypothetical protein SASPL_100018 [Salvia splendens]